MHGVINLLKPPGMTSHDAVALVRRATGIKRVGHTGTLDPAAAGVLPICIGQATRLVEYLQAGSKEYIAEITFGHETDTLDAVGKVVAQADASGVTLETLRAALDPLRGTIQQTPPLYSAIKQGGKKLYELARGGADETEIEIASREVVIYCLSVTRFDEGTITSPPRAMLRIECGGGTYIRSLVRDIGRALGSFATMTFLVRTRNGSFDLDAARTVEEIAADACATMLPLRQVLTWCAREVIVDDQATNDLANGRPAISTAGTAQTGAPLECMLAHLPEHWWEETPQGALIILDGVDPELTLFFDSLGTTAALARAVSSTSKEFKPEKVFHLDAPLD